MAYISPVLSAISGAVKKASVALTRDFNELEHLQNSVHGDNGFAARSLQKVSGVLQNELAKFKPDYAFIISSQGTIPANGNCFLISPIDGYANFAHGNAGFSISVAMMENHVASACVVFAPIYDEMFFAERGNGAFKEGFRNLERIRVASQKQPEKALIGANSDVFAKALQISKNVLVSGSVAHDLAYVAAGKLDAVVAQNVAPAELAAGMLLVKEAGGYIFSLGQTDVRSEDLHKVLFGGSILATNEALKQKIADKMAK